MPFRKGNSIIGNVVKWMVSNFFCFFVIATTNAQEYSQSAPTEKIIGINFFYLNGRDQEGLPQVLQKLAHGDSACKGKTEGIRKRFDATLTTLKNAGYNWVRILVGRGFYQIYSSRCEIDMSSVYPKMSNTQAKILDNMLDSIAQYGFKIELVLSASSKFSDINGDITFFESILNQIDVSNLGLVMLGGDVQPTRSKRHKEWLLHLYRHFTQHKSTRLNQLNYSFDTVTYSQINHFHDYLAWVKNNLHDIPVVTINLYNRTLPPGANWLQYYQAILPYLLAYEQSGLKQSPWIDEYGFRISNPSEATQFTEEDQLAYTKALTYAIHCNRDAPIPAFIWTAGNDRYLADSSRDQLRTPYALFKSYEKNQPILGKTFSWLKHFQTNAGVCDSLNIEYQNYKSSRSS